jgi:hypothetical protein
MGLRPFSHVSTHDRQQIEVRDPTGPRERLHKDLRTPDVESGPSLDAAVDLLPEGKRGDEEPRAVPPAKIVDPPEFPEREILALLGDRRVGHL